MKKEDKDKIIDSLVESFKSCNNYYFTDISNITVEKANKLRRSAFGKNVKVKVAKNSLIKKALQKIDENSFNDLFVTLKGSTAIMFSDVANMPAKVIKEFRKTNDRPILKSAFIDSSVFTGDNQLDTLASLKSKNELIGEIIGLLQSPAQNVISALQSGGGKIAGILKTLEQRPS
ncbi:MAG TPA: 50S ribosomal protein L10 [Bacteroidia bacterium]|nr:50S ribosomal protein L10 [Bacteroidia bacterium]